MATALPCPAANSAGARLSAHSCVVSATKTSSPYELPAVAVCACVFVKLQLPQATATIPVAGKF